MLSVVPCNHNSVTVTISNSQPLLKQSHTLREKRTVQV